MTIISLRYSSAVGSRPNPAYLADGELALNIAAGTGSTGIYFKGSDGKLIKVGPPAYQTNPPYDGGPYGNSVGELWVNPTNNQLKIYTGTTWASIATGNTLTGLTTSDTTALGVGAGQKPGVNIGVNAGKAANGQGSIWIGQDAGGGGGQVTDLGAVVLGYRAAYNTNGMNDTVIIGAQAGENATDLANSVAIGYQALRASKARNNVAVGYQAMTAVTTGGGVAVGYQALLALTAGTKNTAIGSNALKLITTGSNNTAIGENAGASLATGGSNKIGRAHV